MYIPHFQGLQEYNEATGNFDVWKTVPNYPVAMADALVVEWGSGNTIITTIHAGAGSGGSPATAGIYRHTISSYVSIIGNLQAVLGGATGYLRVIAREGGLVE
jgi:hypothetical protein